MRESGGGYVLLVWGCYYRLATANRPAGMMRKIREGSGKSKRQLDQMLMRKAEPREEFEEEGD